VNEQLLAELADRLRSRFYGKYRGIVTDVDASTLRVKATVPAVLGSVPTGWAMPCVPYAGDGVGFFFLPDVGAGVWIEFEGGDVSFPIWTGCYWHADELPSRVAKDVKVIKTKGDQQIVLDDRDHTITITDSNENKVTLDRNGITIVRGSGKLAITDGKVSANDGAMEVT
jgi:uncharacterized protein involved in type VI secretion and phage assembly